MAEDNLETGYTRREILGLGIGSIGALLAGCTLNLATKDFVMSVGHDASDTDLQNHRTQYPPYKPQYIYPYNGWNWGIWYTNGRRQYYPVCPIGTPLPYIWGDIPLMNGPIGGRRLGPYKHY